MGLLFFICINRAIVWLQNQRDLALERNRGPSPRRDDPHEYRIGRLKHERVKVPRGEQLLDWAVQVLKVHADRKSILEVRYLPKLIFCSVVFIKGIIVFIKGIIYVFIFVLIIVYLFFTIP